jgi:hypothetical protein
MPAAGRIQTKQRHATRLRAFFLATTARDGAWYSGRINASYRAASGSANPAMLVTGVNSTKTNCCRI